MKIDVFAPCYNEEIMLPYFIKHYKQFARNITVYDNMSTDNSVKIMKDAGINVIPYDTNGKLEEKELLNIKNNSWKGTDADWVISCDIDELIYHKDILNVLKNIKATHIVTEGYEMMSEKLPTTELQIYDEIKMGFLKQNYSKPCVFKPKDIKDINFTPGCHLAKPTGNVISVKNSGIKLLHYKYINRQILIDKYKHYAIRQSEEMKKNNWGDYHVWTAETINKQFDDWLKLCKNVIG